VDWLLLTHPDQDHCNRVGALVNANYPDYPKKKLRFGNLAFAGQRTEYEDNLIDKVICPQLAAAPQLLADRAHSSISGKTVKPFIECGDVKAYLLSANYPTRDASNTNAKSIVLMFELGKHKVILPGDAEHATEKEIIKNFGHIDGFLKVFALKLGHHGSEAASSQDWVTATSPKAIFSSSDFVWAHPYCKTICRFVQAGTLSSFPDDVWYCCGHRDIYYNNTTTLNICTNLRYYVKSPAGEYLEELDGGMWRSIYGDAGNTFGVQWQLYCDGVRDPSIIATDSVRPADASKIPEGWDCKHPPYLAAVGDDDPSE